MPETNGSAWVGQRVRLRAVEPDDWEAFWRNDDDTDAQRFAWQVPIPRSAQRARDWARDQSLVDWDTTEHIRLAIEALDGGALVGSIVATRLDRRHGTFQYGLAIFASARRKGYASDAIMVLLRYFFEELRFQKVTAYVYAFNEASLALHRRLGFVEEGRMRRAIFTKGTFHDEFVFGMTAEEFAGRE